MTNQQLINKQEDIVHWKYMHPMLGVYTYKNLPEPRSLSDAHRRMVMHQNSVDDIDIQIKIAEMNHSIFIDSYISNTQESLEECSIQKYEAKHKKHMERIVVLLNSKLGHKRKAAAYWFWLQMHDEYYEEKINKDINESNYQNG